jgi:hypothetical protein
VLEHAGKSVLQDFGNRSALLFGSSTKVSDLSFGELAEHDRLASTDLHRGPEFDIYRSVSRLANLGQRFSQQSCA